MAEAATQIDRTSREAEVRSESVRGLEGRDPEAFRKYEYKPTEALPMPRAPQGVHYRFIRHTINSETDVVNMGRYLREGWQPVSLKQHPEMAMSVNPEAKNSDLIQIGDLTLYQISEEFIKSRSRYYADFNGRQMESVDNTFMKENNPKMPLFNNRESRVTFGKGT